MILCVLKCIFTQEFFLKFKILNLIQLQESQNPPYRRYCTVTKWSDSGIDEKCIFVTTQIEMECVLSINAKMGQNFYIGLRPGLTPHFPPFRSAWPETTVYTEGPER